MNIGFAPGWLKCLLNFGFRFWFSFWRFGDWVRSFLDKSTSLSLLGDFIPFLSNRINSGLDWAYNNIMLRFVFRWRVTYLSLSKYDSSFFSFSSCSNGVEYNGFRSTLTKDFFRYTDSRRTRGCMEEVGILWCGGIGGSGVRSLKTFWNTVERCTVIAEKD